MDNLIYAESSDFSLFKKVSGYVPENSGYSTHKKMIPAIKFVEMSFNANSLYDFLHAESFICDDEFEEYKNVKNAEYLVVYKYDTPEAIVLPYTEEDLMLLVGLKTIRKNRTGLEGFYINSKLCNTTQKFYIDRANSILKKLKYQKR